MIKIIYFLNFKISTQFKLTLMLLLGLMRRGYHWMYPKAKFILRGQKITVTYSGHPHYTTHFVGYCEKRVKILKWKKKRNKKSQTHLSPHIFLLQISWPPWITHLTRQIGIWKKKQSLNYTPNSYKNVN
jgi:hypothetical protein